MKKYAIITYTIKNKTKGFYEINRVYVEAKKSADAFEMFEAYCDYHGIDGQYIEVTERKGKEITCAKAYTNGSLGWNPDEYGPKEQPYGEDGKPLVGLLFTNNWED